MSNIDEQGVKCRQCHMRLKKIILAAVAVVAALTASAYEVTPQTKIIIPNMDRTGIGDALKEAATELRMDIEEAMGWKLDVIEAARAGDTLGAILIGEPFAAAVGLVPKDLRFFDNVIAEKDGRLYLFGHDKTCRKSTKPLDWMMCVLPSVKAITEFEYHYMGVRRILPGRTGTEVPCREKISIPDGLYRVNRPRMENGMGRYYGLMYSMANNIFGCGTYTTYGGHLYHAAFPASKYLKEHPEYYAIVGGATTKYVYERPALCITNPDVRRLMVRFILNAFDDGADVVELGQQDSNEYCECPKCQAYGGSEAKTIGEKYWIFHRSIAEELYRQRPNKTVQIISYGPTECLPKTFKEFPPNVMIELMSYSEEVFAAWADYVVPRGFSVYTYMWGEYQQPGLTCKASTPVFARLARRFLKHGVRSIYRCGYGETFGCEGPASYVFNMLLSDPEQDENALSKEYFTAAYGPAADHMRKFHRVYEERVAAWAYCFNDNREWPWPIEFSGQNTMSAIYTPGMFDVCETSLTAAEKTLGLSSKMRRRLELVRREFTYARLTAETCMLYDAYLIAKSDALFEAIATRVERRRALIDTFFDENERAKPIDGWPEYRPFGRRCTKELVKRNGRLFGPLRDAPFTWDIAKMRSAIKAANCAKKSTKASTKCGASPWNEVVGLAPAPSDYKTRFRCSYDDTCFIVEVDAELPDDVKITACGHDGACSRQECLELFIDPQFQKLRNFHFIWNPVEGSCLEEAYGVASNPLDPEADKFQVTWDGKWDYHVTRSGGRWRSVVRIPFTTLGVAKPLSGEKWFLNFGRETFKADQSQKQLWSPSLNALSMSDFESMGVIEFE